MPESRPFLHWFVFGLSQGVQAGTLSCPSPRDLASVMKDAISTPAIGLSLPGVYVVWFLALVLLYRICRWFAVLKESGRGWWWSYL